MRSSSEPSTQEVLAGLVERVTFHNAENGFCVLRAKARGHRDLVTVIGHAAIVSAGEWITASGEWTNDRAHGQQFKARFLKTSAPSSIDGIEKYLGSGMIRGIGPVYAKKMVKAEPRKPPRFVRTFWWCRQSCQTGLHGDNSVVTGKKQGISNDNAAGAPTAPRLPLLNQ
ncbi:MAG: hypothetical protein WAN05_24495 [Roseiarcus sp.]